MKRTGTCPKCDARSIYNSPCIMDRGEGNEAMCLSIGRTDAIEARDVGQFEAYVCQRCGYTELYVINPQELEKLPQAGEQGEHEEERHGLDTLRRRPRDSG